jgi:hypothetical protein
MNLFDLSRPAAEKKGAGAPRLPPPPLTHRPPPASGKLQPGFTPEDAAGILPPMTSHPARTRAGGRRFSHLARAASPAVLFAYLALDPQAVEAQAQPIFPPTGVAPASLETRRSGFQDLWMPWTTFLDVWRVLDMFQVFLLSAVLGAIIAYHPRTREKASTLPELEQPKTFILYALVGALIALIVQAHASMALVVFGIGGLMRFRTDVGPAKDTGRVILTAVVGVCCGLKLMVVAVVATAFGWVLMWLLERETFTRLLIKGLPADALVPAADLYRRVLLASGCRIFGERKKVIGGEVSFVFAAPDPFDRGKFEEKLLLSVPESLRGAIDWDVS